MFYCVLQVNHVPIELPEKVVPVGKLAHQKLRNSIDFIKYTNNFDENVFLNNYLELLGNDSSSFLLAHRYRLEWQAGDPYMNLLNSCRLLSDVGYTIFTVNDNTAEALAYVIASKRAEMY